MDNRNNELIRVLVQDLNRKLQRIETIKADIEHLTEELKELGVDQQGFAITGAVDAAHTPVDLAALDMESLCPRRGWRARGLVMPLPGERKENDND